MRRRSGARPKARVARRIPAECDARIPAFSNGLAPRFSAESRSFCSAELDRTFLRSRSGARPKARAARRIPAECGARIPAFSNGLAPRFSAEGRGFCSAESEDGRFCDRAQAHIPKREPPAAFPLSAALESPPSRMVLRRDSARKAAAFAALSWIGRFCDHALKTRSVVRRFDRVIQQPASPALPAPGRFCVRSGARMV